MGRQSQRQKIKASEPVVIDSNEEGAVGGQPEQNQLAVGDQPDPNQIQVAIGGQPEPVQIEIGTEQVTQNDMLNDLLTLVKDMKQDQKDLRNELLHMQTVVDQQAKQLESRCNEPVLEHGLRNSPNELLIGGGDQPDRATGAVSKQKTRTQSSEIGRSRLQMNLPDMGAQNELFEGSQPVTFPGVMPKIRTSAPSASANEGRSRIPLNLPAHGYRYQKEMQADRNELLNHVRSQAELQHEQYELNQANGDNYMARDIDNLLSLQAQADRESETMRSNLRRNDHGDRISYFSEPVNGYRHSADTHAVREVDLHGNIELPGSTSRSYSGVSPYFSDIDINQNMASQDETGSRRHHGFREDESQSNIRVRPFIPKETDWFSYRNYFDSIASMAGWNNRTKCLKLMGALQGNLTGVTTGMTGNVSYLNLLTRLDAIHGVSTDRQDASSKLDCCSKFDGETIPLFAERIRQLVERAHPNFTAGDKEEQALKAFMRGLPSKFNLRLRMRTAMFRNLRDAVTYGSNLEQVLRQENQVERNRPVRAAFDFSEEEIEFTERDLNFEPTEPVRKVLHDLNKKISRMEKNLSGENEYRRDRTENGNNQSRNHQGEANVVANQNVSQGQNRGQMMTPNRLQGPMMAPVSNRDQVVAPGGTQGQNHFDNRRNNRPCFCCNQLGHWAQQCPNKPQNPPRDGSDRQRLN